MYRKHFGLTRHPFDKRIEPEELFVSAAQRELEARLSHLLDLRGIGVITGESGSGKTTACRKMVASLHTGLHRVLVAQHLLPDSPAAKTACYTAFLAADAVIQEAFRTDPDGDPELLHHLRTMLRAYLDRLVRLL